MYTKEELLKKMEHAKTWREAGLVIDDVRTVLQNSEDNSGRVEEIAELREKVNKLTEVNKQLRAENKQLRSR